jgi:NitT/TauT family transport system substrate-binding protein
MKRRTFLKLAAAPAVLTLVNPRRPSAKEVITHAYLLDPAFEAVLWAIRSGKVTSDLVEVRATPLNIPALIQATATKQYDVVMTAVLGVAAAAARGLELRILFASQQFSEHGEGGGIWVKRDSPITDVAQLKGKTVGSFALRSTGWMYARQAIAKKTGLNVALEGGDFKQVEIVAPNLPGALAAGQVDAAALIHSQAYRARQGGEFRNIFDAIKFMNERYGRLIPSVDVSFPDKLAARPDAFREYSRMYKASAEYALAHRAEVFPAVAREANIDPKFFDWWFDRTTNVPGIFGPEQEKAVLTAWEIAKELNMIKAAPDIKKVTWELALRV